MATGQEQLAQLLDVRLPIGILTDVIAFSLEMAIPLKQELLSEPDVGVRAQRLIEVMDQTAGAEPPSDVVDRHFPPRFSEN